MRVLVVGEGAREHALAWCAARSPRVDAVVSTPGNVGTATVGKNVPLGPLGALDLPAVVAVARRERADLAIVGADDPLAAGLVDALQAAGVPAFGPTKRAAEIESSKAWSKEFMRRHDIPTAPFEVFDDAGAAHRFLETSPWDGRAVVKADGLARGKGVVVCGDLAEAHDAVTSIMESGAFGAAGRRLVIEQRLEGPEASVFALCDGQRAVALGTARDHKRIFDGDRGPNTGGMGAYSPTTLVPPAVLEAVMDGVVRPAVAGMAAEGRPFVGFLYAGLLFAPGGVQVIEFNARFGDPEAQAVFPRLASDLVSLIELTMDGRLDEATPAWRPEASCAVCVASAGYPGQVHDGVPVQGLEDLDPDVLVFHAGTVRRDGALLTQGGRVLTVTGLGTDLAGARRTAYANVERIRFDGMQYRHDIGAREAGDD